MMTPTQLAELQAVKPFATEKQRQYIDAVIEHGSGAKAAEVFGVHKSAVNDGIAAARKKAARNGVAPGHFANGVAPGYLMGKVTVQRGPKGDVMQTWERQSPDQQAQAEAMRAAAEAMCAEMPRVDPIAGPEHTLANLANLYTLTDCHVGMLAWRKEGGDNWDLKIAEATLTACFEQMILRAPKARMAVVNQLGDFLHSDGMLPVTPTSGHILDQDGRFSQLVGAAIRILRRIIDCALMHHEEVVVVLAEGNHDMASSIWLRHMFKALYENEPRLQVVDSELPFYAVQHGNTMLAFHHGHLKKPDDFSILFANQYPDMWGQTRKRYAHAGHQHHLYVKEHGGMTVMQHPTLAARDAYAARGGWFAERAANAITYHDRYGQVALTTVSPEMLE